AKRNRQTAASKDSKTWWRPPIARWLPDSLPKSSVISMIWRLAMPLILKPTWISALVLSLGALPGLAAAADANWPSKPIRVIVPFGPGSSPDVVARIVTDQARKSLGQTIVVENRPGASGNIGTQAIARAAPDGYTFGVSITGPMVNNTVLMKDLPYDPFTELAPLTLAVHQPNVIVVPKQSGITKVEELLKLLKDKPDQLNFP